jgi:hypothetical protein
MLYGTSPTQEAFLRRKLEEQQQQLELQQAIELQGRRFMGLQLLDLKNRALNSPTVTAPSPIAEPNSNLEEDATNQGQLGNIPTILFFSIFFFWFAFFIISLN